MTPGEEDGAERPRAVTIIGRLWLVLAVLLFCKAVVNFAVWKALQPDVPSLIGDALANSPKLPFMKPLLSHITAVMTAQALWWVFVGVAAVGLLRLWPWARVAMQGICGFLLVYFLGLEMFWALVWPNLPSGSARGVALGASSRLAALVAGLIVCAAASAGLIWMIVLLRRPRVRAAFAVEPAKARQA
jgi:branched-subunit amino acid transport protein